jgi:hypothetical protein
MGDFEQICVAMAASGAIIAVRDLAGMFCTVSFRDAVAVGSRLPMDSDFTRQCIETGEVVVCEDAENDARIDPSVATRWGFRSAVAVPIEAQGHVVAVIEVFCPQPSAIYPTAIVSLKRVAKSFAALMIFDAGNGVQPLVGGAPARPMALGGPIADDGASSASSSVSEVVDEQEIQEIRRMVATSPLPSDRPTPPRVWIIAGALLLVLSLVLLFLFSGGHHN